MNNPIPALGRAVSSLAGKRPNPRPEPAPSPEQGATVHVLGNLITFLLRGQDTGMAFSVAECRTAPGAGSPPHLHLEDEEAFHVLEGSYEFTIAGRRVVAGPGSVTTIRRGEPHAFRNAGDAPARMLIVNWPADMHQRFFMAIGDRMEPGTTEFPPMTPPDMGKIMAAAEACGIKLLPPEAL
jgi:mannose-6-phosphate isomerase-like protein (cupin superfamily)